MSQSNNNRSGEFHKIYALNRGKLKHIGTVRARTYVKGVTYSSLLHHPCLMAGIGTQEMQDIRSKGAEFIKLERKDEEMTHSISLVDFLKHSEMRDRGWGLEYECPIHFFETVKEISRAASLNAPVIETARDIIQERRDLQQRLF
jgi:hypothetical protein